MEDKAKILVVDDEECIRVPFGIFLSDAGYNVTTASNYSEAVAALDQMEFDLIIADIILGGRTGLDLASEIRRRGLSSQLVIITGDPTDKSAQYAFSKGVYAYIPKPVYKDKLLRVAESALKHE